MCVGWKGSPFPDAIIQRDPGFSELNGYIVHYRPVVSRGEFTLQIYLPVIPKGQLSTSVNSGSSKVDLANVFLPLSHLYLPLAVMEYFPLVTIRAVCKMQKIIYETYFKYSIGDFSFLKKSHHLYLAVSWLYSLKR